MNESTIGSGSDRRVRGRAGIASALLIVVAAVAVGACGEEESSSGDDGPITVWTLESEPDRITAQEEIMEGFTKESGTAVKVRGIEEDQLRTLITSAAAGGTLPDVMVGLPLSYVPRMADEQISDPEAANAIVEELGADTFAQRALELVGVDGQAQGVPADAWAR